MDKGCNCVGVCVCVCVRGGGVRAGSVETSERQTVS
jgi:hypothetical protein